MRWGLLTSTRCMAPDDGGAGGEAVTQEAPANIENAGQNGPGKSDALASETAGDGADQPSGETTTETTEQPAPKPDKVERRIANLTRKMADEARAREAAERRAEAAEALLNAGKPEATPPARQPTNDIEARATQLVEQREFNRRLSEIDTAGKKDLGADAWEQAKATLTGLGATANQAFLQALAEAENPAKLFAHFADDTDELVELLAKPAAAMAAKIGRLDAKMSQPAAPTPKPLSAAPTPAPKVRGSATPPEPTPYNYPANMSMKDFNAMMDAHLPRSLGGKKARD